ncbi:MAG: DUF484 family protein [Gammaproteobacteria bacterium]|jgi:uncharacterized protein YigA (DUF484 family)
MNSEQKTDAGVTDETAIVEYLRSHPDFFERHQALLEILKLPHPTGGAVSLIERQLGVMRDKIRFLERKLQELVDVARENEQLSMRLHHLALGLIEADSLDAVLALTKEQLREGLRTDYVAIRLFSDEARENDLHFISPSHPALAAETRLFKERRPVCGRFKPELLQLLFGDEAETIESAVLVPLGDRLGLLALGAQDPQRFHPGMGTLFLGYLGDLVGQALTLQLRPAADPAA